MTGRELIMYILTNHLEDEPVFKDGRLMGFMTLEEAAVKLGIGSASVQTMAQLGLIDSVQIAGMTYIPVNLRMDALKDVKTN